MKTPFVFLTGLLSDERVFESQKAHLSDICNTLVISSTADTPNGMLQNILEKAPEQFILAGHSMGGWLALEIMRRAPDRVLKLALLNTTAKEDNIEKRNARQQMIEKAEQGGFQEVVNELVEKLVFKNELKPDVKKMFLEVGQNTFINQEKSMLIREESESILPNITCDTLIIAAAEDKVFSIEEHQELKEKIKNSELKIVKDSGHMSPMEAPNEVFSHLKDWLEKKF